MHDNYEDKQLTKIYEEILTEQIRNFKSGKNYVGLTDSIVEKLKAGLRPKCAEYTPSCKNLSCLKLF